MDKGGASYQIYQETFLHMWPKSREKQLLKKMTETITKPLSEMWMQRKMKQSKGWLHKSEIGRAELEWRSLVVSLWSIFFSLSRSISTFEWDFSFWITTSFAIIFKCYVSYQDCSHVCYFSSSCFTFRIIFHQHSSTLLSSYTYTLALSLRNVHMNYLECH